MTRFRLGWFCYILQKCEKKKRNQEDFVNTVLNKLVGEGNPKTSFIPEINRVSSNRIFTGEEEVPEYYREVLPLTDLDFQSQRISKVLSNLNKEETFHFRQVASKIKNALSEHAKEAKQVFGEEKLKKLHSAKEDEEYIAIMLIYLVNLPNIPTVDDEAKRNAHIIQQTILRFLDNEIVLSLFPHRKHFENLFDFPEINKAFYLEFYSPNQLSQAKTQQNFGIPTLRFLLRERVDKIPLVQNGLILQNDVINERIQQFILDNFKDADSIVLLAGFYDSFDIFCRSLQQYFPKEMSGTLFEMNKLVLSVRTRYDHTADSMKKMIETTNKVTDFLKQQRYTSKENTELVVGGMEELQSKELVFFCLVKL
ncbi:TPA: hypothetical protein VB889_000074 [Streptococcus suis]|nr:hypothetical protein [Streptococcus suis]HEL1811433.1 hypothetical protein [Streptococcus suis]HEM2749757.1 hypothetical protein [Streptococcus suis]HEM5231388.1 hypothetical protein [Streptococcus suis]HEP1806730.1 hypothetical protein [Streptococcus suis]